MLSASEASFFLSLRMAYVKVGLIYSRHGREYVNLGHAYLQRRAAMINLVNY